MADALALRQSPADQIAARERYLASLNITLQRATALYRHGAVSYIEVLSAQRDILPPDKPCWNSTIPVRQMKSPCSPPSAAAGWNNPRSPDHEFTL